MGTRKILPWIAAAGALLTALHPDTSWLVQMPVRGVGVNLTGGLEKNRQRVAAQNPQNVTLALAAAGNDLRKVQALIERFPDSPEVRAAAVRLATCEYGVALPIPKEGREKGLGSTGKVAEAQSIVANAEVGAKLDPENAFFPAMKAVGLLALHQDTEAWAALSEAAKKPRYNDYLAASMHGKLQLLEKTQGRTPNVPAMALIATELFPHYASLRTMAMWAQDKAIASEKAGDTEAGIALRKEVLDFGLLVRRDANTLIGTYVGEAICAIAVGSPGGVKVPELKEFLKTGEPEESAKERRRDQVATAWRAWALKTGHSELAEAAEENHKHITESRAHRQRTEERSMMSLNTVISEVLLLLLAAWLFFSFIATALGSLRPNTSGVTLPTHPMRFVVPAMGMEALGVALVLFAASKGNLSPAWAGAGLLTLGMLLPEIQTALLARRMGTRYKELIPAVRRSVYPVLACLLLIMWTAMMFGLGRQENRWRARLDATINHECAESLRDI